MRRSKIIFTIAAVIFVIILSIFLVGKYGWRLLSFSETLDFDISIHAEGEIEDIIVETAKSEDSTWSMEQGEISENAEDTTMQAYAVILGKYYTAIEERWNGQQLLDAGMNFMIADCYGVEPLENIGYSVADIDGDGTKELAIGTLYGDDFYGKMIFQLYTLDDEMEPLLLFGSMERDRWYYAGDIRFVNIGSSSWNESYETTLKLEGKEMVDMTYTTEPTEYVQMELVPFSIWIPE